MPQTLAVFGATGQQGGSVVRFVLQDPQLSKQYKIRAIARDVNSEKLADVRDKIEIAKGDLSDRASLEAALTGVSTVYLVTNPDFGPNGAENELQIIKQAVDVAVEKSVGHIIFSTLPSAYRISGGKYTKVQHFEGKAQGEDYIRNLPVKSAFISMGSFMQNFHNFPMLGPFKQPDGTFAIVRHNAPKSRMPYVETVADHGKFVGAPLADPEKYDGKTFYGATSLMTMDDIAAAVGKGTGKTVVYRQCSPEEFKQSLPFAGDIFEETFSYSAEYSYWGSDADEGLAWSIANARGKLTTLEEYFQANPLKLE